MDLTCEGAMLRYLKSWTRQLRWQRLPAMLPIPGAVPRATAFVDREAFAFLFSFARWNRSRTITRIQSGRVDKPLRRSC